MRQNESTIFNYIVFNYIISINIYYYIKIIILYIASWLTIHTNNLYLSPYNSKSWILGGSELIVQFEH